MALKRITAEARRAWHVQNDKYSQTKEAKLEDARRRAFAENAGRKAAKSPLHVSKTKANRKPAKRTKGKV
jgi:hypothetical protein